MAGGNLNLIEYLQNCLTTQDGKVLYFLMLIAITMIVDFITGTISAKVNNDIEFRSKEGINGILRKIASMLLMILFVPFAVILPGGVGLSLVYVLYLGYEFMEMKSIVENINKMGGDTQLFNHILDKMQEASNQVHDQEDKKGEK